MKPAFALNLSHDGIGLLRRTSRGWLSIGEVSLDDPKLGESLSYLRKTALALSPAGVAAKLIIPNSQILYTEIEAPGPDDAARRAQIATALEGRTPYEVKDLVFDWRGEGPVVQVAVVARETLAEAEAFAEDYRFGPLSFVAIPDTGSFTGEPFFGEAASAASHLPEGEALERDDTPVRIIGRNDAVVARAAETPVAVAEDIPAEPAEPEAAADMVLEPEPELPLSETAEPQEPQRDIQPATTEAPPVPAATGKAEEEPPRPVETAEADAAAFVAPKPASKDDEAAEEPPQADAPETPDAEDRPETELPPPAQQGKGEGRKRKPARRKTPAVVAERRAAPPPPEVAGFTGIGARIADRRAEMAENGMLLPIAAGGALIILLVVLWLVFGGRGADIAPANAPEGPATLETAIAPPEPLAPGEAAIPPGPDSPGTGEGAATQGAETAPVPEPEIAAATPEPEAAPTAPGDAPPVVGFEPPAQPLAQPDGLQDQAALPAETAPQEPRASPAPAPTAQADSAPAAPPDPAQPSGTIADGGQDYPEIDPDIRYDLTGVWTRPPPEVTAPDPAPDAGLQTAPDRQVAIPVAAPRLAALAPDGAGTNPAPQPNPPPFRAPPRRDAEGRIVPTPEGVVTADGVTLFAGTPPVVAPPRPAAAAPTAEPPDPLEEFRPRPRPEGIAPEDDAAVPEPEPAPPLPETDIAATAPDIAPDTDADADAEPGGTEEITVFRADPDLADARPRPPPDELRDDAARTEAADTETAADIPAPALDPADTLAADPALADARPRPPTAAVIARAQSAAELEAALAEASDLAVASSRRPLPRPRDFSDGIAEAIALAVAEAPLEVDNEPEPEPEPRAAVPNIPTSATVAEEATIASALRLNDLNLIGVYGSSGARRALIRTPTGRFLRVEVGDRLDGGRVAAIGETELSYVKNGRTIVLKLPQEG